MARWIKRGVGVYMFLVGESGRIREPTWLECENFGLSPTNTLQGAKAIAKRYTDATGNNVHILKELGVIYL